MSVNPSDKPASNPPKLSKKYWPIINTPAADNDLLDSRNIEAQSNDRAPKAKINKKIPKA